MRLDHVGVTVRDLAGMSTWYCAAFGLERELVLRVEPIDLDIVMLSSARFGYRVELLHRPGSAAHDKPADPGAAALREGFSHVAFDVPELDQAHQRLLSLEAVEVLSPRPSPEPGVRMSYLADIEGNLVELVERHPD